MIDRAMNDHGFEPSVGDRLPDLVRTLGPADLMAYGAATWDWHRLHHDAGWAATAGFDRPVVDGQMLGALLAHQVTTWAPPGAGLTRLHFRNRAPVLSGSTVVCSGTVVEVSSDGSVTVDLEIRVDDEVVVAPAGAVVDLEREAPPRARLHHTHLFASDLDASLEFYRRWFGAEVLGDEVFAGSRNVLVAVGDGRLNFYDQPPPNRGRNAVHHLGIQTDDLAALVERMRAGGVAFRKPITEVDQLSYVMVEGPDDVLIELFEADAADHRGGTARWFAW